MLHFHKAKAWDGEKRYPWVHAKLDGHRVKIAGGRVYSTHPHDLTEDFQQLPVWPALSRLPVGTELDAEIWMPGRPASDVKTYLLAHDPRLMFSVFSVPSLPHDAPLDDVHDRVDNWDLDFAPYWHTDEWCWTTMLPSAKSQVGMPDYGIEGFVFKESNLGEWVKHKYERTIDCVVTGFKDGKGKYEGFVGALIVSVGDHEVANVGGMDDETRYAISETRDWGRVVEVKYQYVGSNGRLRHPRFVRWRDDKPACDCTPDQDPALVEFLAQ